MLGSTDKETVFRPEAAACYPHHQTNATVTIADDPYVSGEKGANCLRQTEPVRVWAAIDADWLRSRYFAIEPSDFGRDPSEDDFEYTWGWFSALPLFYAKASEAYRHVIFTVDL